MISINRSEVYLDELGKASRRAATVSLLGFLLVMAAIGYSVFQLTLLERQRISMQGELMKLRTETERYRSDLAKSRASLASARAAINAFHSGRLEDAVSLYDEALAADPENAYLQNLRAYSLFRLGRIDAALEGQRRSVSADPNYAWGYFDMARFLCATTPPKIDEARKAAAKAIELRPSMLDIMQRDGEFQRVCQHRVP